MFSILSILILHFSFAYNTDNDTERHTAVKYEQDSVVNQIYYESELDSKEVVYNGKYLQPEISFKLLLDNSDNSIGFDSEGLGYHSLGMYYIYHNDDTLKYYKYNDFYDIIEVKDKNKDSSNLFKKMIKMGGLVKRNIDIDTLTPKYEFILEKITDSTLVYRALQPLASFSNWDNSIFKKHQGRYSKIIQKFYFSVKK